MKVYSKEEVFESTLQYFNNDELATNVWIDKYALKNNEGELLELNPDDTHHRIAKEIARIESKYENPMTEEQIYEFIKGFKYFVFGGSGMYGIGNDYSLSSLANCFVIGNESDSYGGILTDDQELVQLMKRRGGVGLDLSHLRPEGTKTTNSAGNSSGAVSFASRYSNSTREVAQGGGRRGALMLSMSIKHPDVEQFVFCKNDKTKVTGANISVKVDKEFMDAVKNDGDYLQTFPIDIQPLEDYDEVLKQLSYNELVGAFDKYNGNFYVKKIKARELWNKIIHQATASAEPGILFWDTIKEESIPSCYGKEWEESSTNPCFTGDTIIAVADGRNGVSIKELTERGEDVPVYCMDENGFLKIKTMRNPRITGFNQKIYKITLDSGDIIRVTGNHRFYLKNGLIKEAINLLKGDSLQIFSKVSIEKNSNKEVTLHLNGSNIKEHRFIIESFVRKLKDEEMVHHIDENPYNNTLTNLQIITNSLHNEIHNKSYPGELNGNYSGISNKELKERAIFLTKSLNRRLSKVEWCRLNDSVFGWSEYRKELGLTLTDFLRNVAIECGIDKELIDLDPRVVKSYQAAIEQGYKCKIENNQVFVQKKCENCNNLFWVKFLQREISFCNQKCAINNLNKKRWSDNSLKEKVDSEYYNHKVLSVEFDGYEDVYNGTVDEFHNLFIGGFNSKLRLGHKKVTYCLTAQCGEIPLNQYDSCRLSSLNLYSYVENPFTQEASFNWDLFKQHCQLGQRLMDDLVDLEEEKVNQIIAKVEQDKQSSHIKHIELVLWEKIRKTLLQGRRTGFGITGEADMLAALGLKYGTKEATEFAVLIHKTFAIEAYKSSIQLAKERGCFPIWNLETEHNNSFITRITNEFVEEYEKNESNNFLLEEYEKYGRRNIACLTIAPNGTLSLMTQTTSGIEPVFEVSYKRRRKVFTNTEIKDQTGDNWEEYKVFHPKFIEWYLFNSELTSHQSVLEYFSQLKDDDLKFLIKGSPYYQATANEIDYLEKVKMQGEIQKWIDHSISVTHNLPKGISEEEVAKIYMKAYEVGCKGVTVYVDGSRSGVLIKNEENLVKTNLNKRPESLQCDIYVTKVKGKDWVVLIGVNNDVPYECFAFKQKNLKITHDLPNARLIKRKEKGVNYYDLLANSHFRLDDISSFFELGEEQSLTRSISLSLRYNIPIVDICDQLDKATGSVVELSKALLRVLKKYIKEGNIGKECPNCGSKEGLISQGGCITCKDCGYSKC